MRKALVCVMLALSLVLTGCELIPIFGPIVNVYVTWRAGEGHAYFATNSTIAYKAVKRTLTKMEYPIYADEDKGEGNYYVGSGESDQFKINIKKMEPFVTKISIRVNFWGDKPYAELIFKELQSQLDIIDYESMSKRRHRRD